MRDNPGTDLSGLNRDLGKALTQEETANFKFSLKDYTGYVSTALSMPGYLDNAVFFVEKPITFVKTKVDEFINGINIFGLLGKKQTEEKKEGGE